MTDENPYTDGIEPGSLWVRDEHRPGRARSIEVVAVDPPFEVRWRDLDPHGAPGRGAMFASTLRRDYTEVVPRGAGHPDGITLPPFAERAIVDAVAGIADEKLRKDTAS